MATEQVYMEWADATLFSQIGVSFQHEDWQKRSGQKKWKKMLHSIHGRLAAWMQVDMRDGMIAAKAYTERILLALRN